MQFMLVHNKEDLRHQQYKTKHFLTIANIFSKKKKKKKKTNRRKILILQSKTCFVNDAFFFYFVVIFSNVCRRLLTL